MKNLFSKQCLFLWLLLAAPFASFYAHGQLSDGGRPLALPMMKSARSVVPEVVFSVDVKDVERFDSEVDTTLKVCRFAYPIETCLNLNNSGTWHSLEDCNVWTIDIFAPEAFSLGLIFNQFVIPEGSKLFVFDSDGREIRGAYTSKNVQKHGKFAFFPISSDRIMVQYEEPKNASFHGSIEIGQVSYGYKNFVGNERHPFGTQKVGGCNINVNCDSDQRLKNHSRAVCRVLANGVDFSTGTLINNTANNGKPYLIAAFHAFKEKEEYAATAVVQFGYESPTCVQFDGDNHFTLSGATALAWSSTLDFILLELNDVPPAYFRPYYAGWDCSGTAPSVKNVIHQPWGDVKKVSYDEDMSTMANYSNMASPGVYYANGFWRVIGWDKGTTESGSSGATLIDAEGRIIGTLTGGAASCSNMGGSDYFSRFDLQWNAYEDLSQQLKTWLDPLELGVKTLDGYDPYLGNIENCVLLSNFKTYDIFKLISSGSDGSVYTGTNDLGITNLSEKFEQTGISYISGILLGVANIDNKENGTIEVSIYAGDSIPTEKLSTQTIPLSTLADSAMNYISFDTSVMVNGSFFVDVALPQTSDVFQLYQSDFRNSSEENSLYLKRNGTWVLASSLYGTARSTASLMLQAICHGNQINGLDDSLEIPVSQFVMYPNPTRLDVKIEFDEMVDSAVIEIYDMQGRSVYNKCVENKRIENVDLSNLLPNVYFVRVERNGMNSVRKLMVKR